MAGEWFPKFELNTNNFSNIGSLVTPRELRLKYGMFLYNDEIERELNGALTKDQFELIKKLDRKLTKAFHAVKPGGNNATSSDYLRYLIALRQLANYKVRFKHMNWPMLRIEAAAVSSAAISEVERYNTTCYNPNNDNWKDLHADTVKQLTSADKYIYEQVKAERVAITAVAIKERQMWPPNLLGNYACTPVPVDKRDKNGWIMCSYCNKNTVNVKLPCGHVFHCLQCFLNHRSVMNHPYRCRHCEEEFATFTFKTFINTTPDPPEEEPAQNIDSSSSNKRGRDDSLVVHKRIEVCNFEVDSDSDLEL